MDSAASIPHARDFIGVAAFAHHDRQVFRVIIGCDSYSHCVVVQGKAHVLEDAILGKINSAGLQFAHSLDPDALNCGLLPLVVPASDERRIFSPQVCPSQHQLLVEVKRLSGQSDSYVCVASHECGQPTRDETFHFCAGVLCSKPVLGLA
jgi:hypothetical protein